MIKTIHNHPWYCRPHCRKPRKPPKGTITQTKSRRPAGTPEGWRLFPVCPWQPRKKPAPSGRLSLLPDRAGFGQRPQWRFRHSPADTPSSFLNTREKWAVSA